MSASLKNQQGFSPAGGNVGDGVDGDDCHCVIGFPANINEQSCQQKPVPTALAAWLAANATARDFATCQLAGQPNADIAGGMCQHQRYASFTRGQRRRDDPPALPESSVVRSRYVKGLPFQSSGRAGSVDGVYCRTRTAGRSFRTRDDSGAKYRYGTVAANDPVAKVWYCGKH